MNLLNPVFHLQIANVLLFIGNILLIWKVVKDRNVLRGFDMVGSLLTFVASLFILSYLGQFNLWFSFWLSTLTTLFWGSVLYFILRGRASRKLESDHIVDAISYMNMPVIVCSNHLNELMNASGLICIDERGRIESFERKRVS